MGEKERGVGERNGPHGASGVDLGEDLGLGAASSFLGGRGEQDDLLAGLTPDIGVEQQGLGGL